MTDPQTGAQLPRKSRTVATVISTICAVLALEAIAFVVLANIGGWSIHVDHRHADYNVKIVTCGLHQALDHQAGFAVVATTNLSDHPAAYSVDIAFKSTNGNVWYQTVHVTVDDVAPGQTATARADSTVRVTDGLQCVALDAARM